MLLLRPALVALLLLLTACEQGRLSLSLGDAPIDGATDVIVQIPAVLIEKSDGARERFSFSPPLRLDLLQLQNGDTTTLLDEVRLDEDDYVAVHLEIDADGTLEQSSMLTGNERVALRLSDDDAALLRMPIAFRIERDDSLELVVDFDLRQSVRPRTGTQPFPLRPMLRIHRARDVGSIAGEVDASLIGATACTPWIYAYAGSGATPNDIGSSATVLASVLVARNTASGRGSYRMGLLPVGDYTLALTCQGDADALDSDESTISFAPQHNVHVDAGAEVTRNF